MTDTPKQTPTPETDAEMFTAWRWDTDKMDYVPHGIACFADLAQKLERELAEARERERVAIAERDADKSRLDWLCPLGWTPEAFRADIDKGMAE